MERKTSTQSPDDVESYDEENEKIVNKDEDEVEEGERESDENDDDGDEGLRLPLTTLHHQLVEFMGLSISQIALNA